MKIRAALISFCLAGLGLVNANALEIKGTLEIVSEIPTRIDIPGKEFRVKAKIPSSLKISDGGLGWGIGSLDFDNSAGFKAMANGTNGYGFMSSESVRDSISWETEPFGREATFIFYPKRSGKYNFTLAARGPNFEINKVITLNILPNSAILPVPDISKVFEIETEVSEPGSDEIAFVRARIKYPSENTNTQGTVTIIRLMDDLGGSTRQYVSRPESGKWNNFEISRSDYLLKGAHFYVEAEFWEEKDLNRTWSQIYSKEIPIVINFSKENTSIAAEYLFYLQSNEFKSTKETFETYDAKSFQNLDFEILTYINWQNLPIKTVQVSRQFEGFKEIAGEWVSFGKSEVLDLSRMYPKDSKSGYLKLPVNCSGSCLQKYRIVETQTRKIISEFGVNIKEVVPPPQPVYRSDSQQAALRVKITAPGQMIAGKRYKITVKTTPSITGNCSLHVFERQRFVFGSLTLRNGFGSYFGTVTIPYSGYRPMYAICSGKTSNGKTISGNGNFAFWGK
jgi:hypothetical protein